MALVHLCSRPLRLASPRLFTSCLELSAHGSAGGELFVGLSLPSVEVEVVLVAAEPVRPVAMYMLVQGGR